MEVNNPKRLKAVGPIDSVHGYPLWFEDENGVRLELGLAPDPLTPAIGDLPEPENPLSFPDNFPDESFYFMAEAELEVGGNGTVGRARVILALEAAFGGDGTPQAGMNVVFARIRVRMDDLIPGARYEVTHPYGVIGSVIEGEEGSEKLVADDRGRVFYTEDLGLVPGDPTAVLDSGKVAPFLVGTSVAPDGYIGDGVTEQQVTGSPFSTPLPNRNFVRIRGSRIAEGTNNPDPSDLTNSELVWTNKFTVQGRKAKQVGAWLESATYERTASGFLLKVQARSLAHPDLPSPDLRLVAPGIHIKLDRQGEYYTGIGQAATIPNDARLVNIGDNPPTSYPVKFTDLVIVESAVHDRNTGALTVKARSSDADPSTTLTLKELNLALTTNPQTFAVGAALPAEITVTSNKGGTGRQRVEVKGAPATNQPVKAIIAPVPEAFAGEQITLDGSASLNATGFTWRQTAGTPGFFTIRTSAKTAFTPTSAGDYTFELTVQGNGGPSTATTIPPVKVKPAPSDAPPTITRSQYRTGTRQFRIDGTVSAEQVPDVITVALHNRLLGTDEELGIARPDINGDWSLRRVLLAADSELLPTLGDSIKATSRHGGSAERTLTFGN